MSEQSEHTIESSIHYAELQRILHFALQEIHLLNDQYRILELKFQETHSENQNLKQQLEQFGKQYESLKMRMRDMHNQLAQSVQNPF
jgi:predicted nuclease with TOPRIM domain